jgi:hypothetical protein
MTGLTAWTWKERWTCMHQWDCALGRSGLSLLAAAATRSRQPRISPRSSLLRLTTPGLSGSTAIAHRPWPITAESTHATSSSGFIARLTCFTYLLCFTLLYFTLRHGTVPWCCCLEKAPVIVSANNAAAAAHSPRPPRLIVSIPRHAPVPRSLPKTDTAPTGKLTSKIISGIEGTKPCYPTISSGGPFAFPYVEATAAPPPSGLLFRNSALCLATEGFCRRQ